jgi:beta-barrel assembly-enhancing protease
VRARLLLVLVIAAVAVGGYYCRTSKNPITGETQRVALSREQEIVLGLQSVPELKKQFGGDDPSRADGERVDRIGARLLSAIPKATDSKEGYRFEFHLLADPQTVNAFALPGGQVFITRALYDRLPSDAMLAGVLGHEIGHVIHRHGAEHLAKQGLISGLAGALVVGASDYADPRSTQVIAQAVGSIVMMKHGRDDERESDRYGVETMIAAKYDPNALVGVMDVLAKSSGGGGKRAPEWASTHPSSENRIELIRAEIAKRLPGGVPADFDR